VRERLPSLGMEPIESWRDGRGAGWPGREEEDTEEGMGHSSGVSEVLLEE